MEFSVRLKELRVDNDMSQTELAEKLNLKASAISKYEKGITQPSIDTLKSLAEIFSVTVDYLIGMSDIKNPYSNSQITPNEADLIEHFRQLTYENKIRIDERIKNQLQQSQTGSHYQRVVRNRRRCCSTWRIKIVIPQYSRSGIDNNFALFFVDKG